MICQAITTLVHKMFLPVAYVRGNETQISVFLYFEGFSYF